MCACRMYVQGSFGIFGLVSEPYHAFLVVSDVFFPGVGILSGLFFIRLLFIFSSFITLSYPFLSFLSFLPFLPFLSFLSFLPFLSFLFFIYFLFFIFFVFFFFFYNSRISFFSILFVSSLFF